MLQLNIRYKFNIVILISWICVILAKSCFAAVELEAVYPYNMTRRDVHVVGRGSTVPLYLNLKSYDVPHKQQAQIRVTLPEGFAAVPGHGWLMQGNTAQAVFTLPADFGQTFDLLYLRAADTALPGEKKLLIEAYTDTWREKREISFAYDNTAAAAEAPAALQKADNKRFNWYIQSVSLPVDNLGQRDDKAENGVIYVRDTALEGFRNRMTGDGAANWSAIFSHPATHVLLEMRNPQRDVRVLRFKAQLLDKVTGEPVAGLCTAAKVNDDSEHGWAGDTGSESESRALISLDGQKAQSFILPLYVDYFKILEGDYSLRITVSGNGQEKVQEMPVRITKKHDLGLAAVGFSFICLAAAAFYLLRLRRCIYQVGAKGAIAIALFAAVSFGGIVLPTTVFGDFLHVFLGPFSGLFTGLLSGVLQYLLLVSLLMLFRRPGVAALLYLVRFMLSGLMFGHFTPLGLLSCCVNIVTLEFTLYMTGFYRGGEPGRRYMLLLSLALGAADALITFVNLEQMMFFYRLYYADWYVALYMLVNGFFYSSIGSFLGYKTGLQLRQVMGE